MEKTEEVKTEIETAGVFFGPEGVIMMAVAIFVDLSEFLVEFIPGIGQIISILIDIFAVLFIGGWMYVRSGTIKITGKTAVRIGKALKWAKRIRWLRPLCFVLECIPGIVGSLPLWIIIVYLELKYS